MTMFAIANERMNVSISDAEVGALVIGTGVALGVHADGALPGGFSPHTKAAQLEVLALPPTRERGRDDKRGSRQGCEV